MKVSTRLSGFKNGICFTLCNSSQLSGKMRAQMALSRSTYTVQVIYVISSVPTLRLAHPDRNTACLCCGGEHPPADAPRACHSVCESPRPGRHGDRHSGRQPDPVSRLQPEGRGRQQLARHSGGRFHTSQLLALRILPACQCVSVHSGDRL